MLIPSREDDAPELVRFGDGQVLRVPGHGGEVNLHDGNIYMAMALRNGGAGLAVLHGWRVEVARSAQGASAPDLSEFRRQQRDLFIPAGDTGFWQGAIRDREDPVYEPLRAALERDERLMIDLLFGDHEGGQRTIARFTIGTVPEQAASRAEVMRYWNVDREDPR